MKEQILNYIAACEQNIIEYKKLGDEKAVQAAEKMIVNFQKVLETVDG